MKGNEHHSKFLLTHREREVFELLVQDKTTRDIAGLLFISEKTVRNHISKEMWFEVPFPSLRGDVFDTVSSKSFNHKYWIIQPAR
ncbi:hypothetical protein PAECIP111892_03607 [Paenibacillus auburnensis]|uniref:HTH luxR-type domain-containing protein n=1 Tax=Paenibacillus auburnensis TaxID=2905649 RepID=A0ABN8GPD0_9BACL|nr:helix-turn-helix transcriptional regulator [Paenibacillus auburnensis]CAH1211612.1 hypothetical protein PAECIP111892_03607 [Paenibacillus auburnensis]